MGLRLLLFSRPLTKGEMSNRRFFSRGRGRRSRRRVQPHLNDKMAEGVSNIMRERYLTFSVSADTVEESVPSWRACAPWRTACSGHAQRPACAGRGTPAADTVDDAAGARRVEFVRRAGVTRGITAKDLACPDTMEFAGGSASCFTSDGVCQVLAFRSFEQPDRPLPGGHGGPSHAVGHQLPREGHEPRVGQGRVRRRLKWIDKEMSEDQMGHK
ncbi:MAG: hypothetical protein ACLTMP_09340 [Eggerthella lenta]